MINVWDIERDTDYLKWFKAIYDASDYPLGTGRGQLAPGKKNIGRTLVFAEPGAQGMISFGVQLNTNQEFWKAFPGSFAYLLEHEMNAGLSFDSNYERTSLHFPRLRKEHGKVVRLEYCSSHIGGFVAALFEDGERYTIDGC